MSEQSRSIALTVNGEDVRETVEARTSLIDFLRERLGLTGSHVGCEQPPAGYVPSLTARRRGCFPRYRFTVML